MISGKIKLLNRSSLSFCMMVLLLLIMLNRINLNAQNPTANQAAKPPSPTGLTIRAPDTMPGTLPDMRNTSYWIARMTNPDTVVMTLTEIQNRNNAFFKRLENFSQLDSSLQKQINTELLSRPGLLTSIPDVSTKTTAEVSALVTSWIDTEIQFLTRHRSENILHIPYADWEIQNISDEMASAKTANHLKIQSAIIVKDCRLRIIPDLRPEYLGNIYLEYSGTDYLSDWDMWNLDIVPIATPIRILSTSKTGGFLFVLTDRGYGWIDSEDLAIGSIEEIDNYNNSYIGNNLFHDFIICTGDKVPFYTDSTCTYVSGWFRMGDHLNVRDSYNIRSVLVPTRQINGSLSFQEAWLKKDADVSRGYLSYTRRNVVLQAFKLLDNIYDWTGGWFGRDHATQLRDIFSVFGFKWPSMGGLLSAYIPDAKIVYPKNGLETQIKAILANEPFLTIQICRSGHSQLFLGNYNGVPILFDTHGYRYTDSQGNTCIVRRCNIGTIAMPDYFLKQDIRFLELK